ncbi:hypothetical protein SODG_000084 [Sodalis praecaptivus]|nr:hypothetical protein NVIRENTERO_00584 [Sodalis praecaptivus]
MTRICQSQTAGRPTKAVNRRSQSQFLGPKEENVTLSGVQLPEITRGRIALMALQKMAETGKAWSLMQGDYLVGSEENVRVLRHTHASKHNAERAARAN